MEQSFLVQDFLGLSSCSLQHLGTIQGRDWHADSLKTLKYSSNVKGVL